MRLPTVVAQVWTVVDPWSTEVGRVSVVDGSAVHRWTSKTPSELVRPWDSPINSTGPSGSSLRVPQVVVDGSNFGAAFYLD